MSHLHHARNDARDAPVQPKHTRAEVLAALDRIAIGAGLPSYTEMAQALRNVNYGPTGEGRQIYDIVQRLDNP